MIGFDDIEYASLTDVGMRRSHNQDAHATLPATDLEQFQARGHVFLVADGMGAHAVGELASKLAADSIPHIYSKHAKEGPIPALRKAFVEANQHIHNRGQANREFEGMGTTATAIVLRPEGAWVGHVGDSRAYRIRNGKIEQLSFDHSLVWELARRQRKAPEELHGIPPNVIVRSLGPDSNVQVDVEGPHPLLPGDAYLLCSDGLTGPVSDREIGSVAMTMPPGEACRFLIQLANMQGGQDNITCLIVRISAEGVPVNSDGSINIAAAPAFVPPREPWSARLKRLPWPIILLSLGIALAALAAWIAVDERRGALPTFIVAGITLLGGVVALLVQHHRESQQTEEPEEERTLQVYRQAACGIDKAMIERLEHGLTILQQRVRDNHWQADDALSQQYRTIGKQAQAAGDLPEAFRAHCRAMLVLMEAIHQNRGGGGESFKPIWD